MIGCSLYMRGNCEKNSWQPSEKQGKRNKPPVNTLCLCIYTPSYKSSVVYDVCIYDGEDWVSQQSYTVHSFSYFDYWLIIPSLKDEGATCTCVGIAKKDEQKETK